MTRSIAFVAIAALSILAAGCTTMTPQQMAAEEAAHSQDTDFSRCQSGACGNYHGAGAMHSIQSAPVRFGR